MLQEVQTRPIVFAGVQSLPGLEDLQEQLHQAEEQDHDFYEGSDDEASASIIEEEEGDSQDFEYAASA